jgi:hypothetical protein
MAFGEGEKLGADLPGPNWSRTNGRLDRNREITVMPRTRYTPEEILQHLRTVELDTGKGLAVLDACWKLGITKQAAGAVLERLAVLHAQDTPL